ncbi:MAG TPA: P63C domain-containing protein [Solirubrobacteraceae bacterium]|nr:P63C domain-containing protein [Solirubrobacteraceae bacterium]
MTEDSQDEVSEGARVLSRRGASAGGIARAERLSPEERSAIAQQAAAARWGTPAVPAPNDGEIVIGDRRIKCAVTEDGTRLINQETFLIALGRAPKAKGGTGVRSNLVPAFLSAANLRPYISLELQELAEPILYAPLRGGRAYGYRAELLPAVCEVYLDADADKMLLKSQRPAADAAQILIRGLARTGIIALVDEATGYQETRARDELQRILEAYVTAELRPWLKRFPDDFFKEIYRLQEWEYKPGTSKRTPYVGKLVNKYIYEQLPPGVHDELKRLNPRTERGYRRHKFFQFLTADTGNPQLDKQISTVTTLMRISRNKTEFEDLFERAFPPIEPRLPLVIDVEGEED